MMINDAGIGASHACGCLPNTSNLTGARGFTSARSCHVTAAPAAASAGGAFASPAAASVHALDASAAGERSCAIAPSGGHPGGHAPRASATATASCGFYRLTASA